MKRFMSLGLSLLLGACTSGMNTGDGEPSLIAARPYQSKVPAAYDASKPWPLLILLHGYTGSGAEQDAYFGFSKIVDSKGFLYAYPDGTKDALDARFWNATDACCNFNDPKVDDVAYLNAVISDMSSKYNVDPKRVFFVGHSNGGFMSHRLACDAAPRIAAIVALAGDNWNDVSNCRPADKVAVLQIHGDADTVISYGGGQLSGHTYPSAQNSVGSWVQLNGCMQTSTMGAALDLESSLAGAETTVAQWGGCQPGGAAELWTIHGGSHIPMLQPTWADTLYGWLAAHAKP